MSGASKTIAISTGSIFKVIMILLSFWSVFLITDMFILLFVALVMASALDPLVDVLKKWKIPRSVSMVFVYLLLLGAFSAIVTLIAPPVVEQFKALIGHVPELVAWAQGLLAQMSIVVPEAAQQADVIKIQALENTGQLLSAAGGILGGLVSIVIIGVMTFYFAVEEEGLKKFVGTITPIKNNPYIFSLINRIQRRLGHWLKGQVLLSFIIFILEYIGLTILGVEYALVLALLGGMLEIIPMLGPVIAAIPAVFLAFTISPTKALFVIVLFVIIQQLENHIIAPNVFGASVGLNPLVVIIAIMIGATLAGALGALVAVPVATAIGVYMDDLSEKKNKLEPA